MGMTRLNWKPEAIRLRREGLTFAAIAKQLGLSRSKVGGYLKRAQKKGVDLPVLSRGRKTVNMKRPPTQRQIWALRFMRAGWRPSEVAWLFDLPINTLYTWRKNA